MNNYDVGKNKKNAYFSYWGKARRSKHSNEIEYHLLPYHSLDVAAVASVWWDHSQVIRNSFLRTMDNLSAEQVKNLVLFFIALHDYGKLDIRFQYKAIAAWKSLNKSNVEQNITLPTIESCRTYDHGKAGLFWFDSDYDKNNEVDSFDDMDIFASIADCDDEESEDNNRIKWIKAVVGHHGFVFSDEHMPSNERLDSRYELWAKKDKQARLDWVEALEQIFLKPSGLLFDDIPYPPSSLLAGFCSISDWLGSRSDEENFTYNSLPSNNLSELKKYFDNKCEYDAKRVFELSGIGGKAKPYKDVEALLKQGYKPRQLQTLVSNLPAESGLTIVEAPTGSGKTEMALAYAWRLLEANQADSIIFAMPTQATSNAMLERLEQLATTVFEENPNVLLAHGHARFNKKFLSMKVANKTVQNNDEAWAQCNEWLGQSRKRLFLGQIGVCTIDQVLVSVLPVKHRFVRGFGIGRSVLIIDEVHAYDAYMYGLLEEVLKAQKHVGAASVLLSATLPANLKHTLLATNQSVQSHIDSAAPYPLITYTKDNVSQTFTLPSEQLPPMRKVSFELNEDKNLLPDMQLCRRIIDAAEQGAQVAIVCNLVDAAQQLAKQLQAMVEESGLVIDVDIFHARYCLSHRQKKESAVLNAFGKEGKRKTGRILVATQVIEQSLDVDFDWLITQLCPIDLLFQRIGRLHRHDECLRPEGFQHPLCTILLPLNHDYGTHGLIYSNTRVIWRTEQMLRDCSERVIEFPAAYREWIEPIYQDEAWGNEPDEVEEGFVKFENEVSIKRDSAKLMIKWGEDCCLNDGNEQITAVTRDGEFSLRVVPYIKVTEGKQLLNNAVFETLDERKQLEALSLNAVGVPHSWHKFLPNADEDGYIWLEMAANEEVWAATCNNVMLNYHPNWGMIKGSD